MGTYTDSAGTLRDTQGVQGGGTASGPSIVKPAGFTQLGYQQITNATLASSSALTVPTGASGGNANFPNTTYYGSGSLVHLNVAGQTLVKNILKPLIKTALA